MHVIHTIYDVLIMLGHTHNSRKRNAQEARDSHQLIYSLKQEGPVFPIIFEGREVLPPHNKKCTLLKNITTSEVLFVYMAFVEKEPNVILVVDKERK